MIPSNAGAAFSPCRTWRYALWRRWRVLAPENIRYAAFIGLNPSTADETTDDPTVTRCIRYAQGWGYDGMVMLNLFAFRSTDPAGLFDAEDPIGKDNDEALRRWAGGASVVVAAWGVHGELFGRNRRVQTLLAGHGLALHCLKLTKGGHPGHPLYLRKDLVPIPYRTPVL